MLRRPMAQYFSVSRDIFLAALLVASAGCVTVEDGSALWDLDRLSSDELGLPEAEQMIDDLDRTMTAYGTISIKTPDVWGQDRLAKFRSEYEAQMAGWLKQGFKSEINAAVRHHEAEATQVQLGGN